MKKAFIAILVILTVFSASVFADEGFENYSGLSIGFGFSKVKYSNSNDVFDKRVGTDLQESSNPLVISLTDYAILENSPIGIYGDIGLTIPLNFKEENSKSDNGVGGIFLGVGPAFKLEVSKDAALLIGAGFHFQMTSKTNGDNYRMERMYFGAGADIQASYKLGKKFAIALGASGSYFFANYSRLVTLNNSYNKSLSKYSEFRVVPKISGYYVY